MCEGLGFGSEVRDRCLLPNTVLHGLAPAEVPGMRMIYDSKDGFTFRADHDEDFHSVDARMLGAWRIDLNLAMGTFHAATSALTSVVY